MDRVQQSKMVKKFIIGSLVTLICYSLDSNSIAIVDTLPGYNATLPFKLETGYVSLGEKGEQLFYYFIESERDPGTDPLILWLTGGPGCTGFSALVYEIGPLAFDAETCDGALPSFTLNPYSWTKVANIIFIDSPVGTGFSYSATYEGYFSSDLQAAKDNYIFLKNWLSTHPSFMKNRLYIGAGSYGGKIAPMLALEIVKGNEAGLKPPLFLQGYIIGNPITDKMETNERVPYAHRMGLISDEYFELAKNSCGGEYMNPDPNNVQCIRALDRFKECTDGINEYYILDPKCNSYGVGPHEDYDPASNEDSFLSLSRKEKPFCRHYNYLCGYVWANDERVQEALDVRKGTKGEWKRCNRSVAYEENVDSVVEVHRVLMSEKGVDALVFSGDHDMTFSYMGTLKWIRSLNLNVDENWRPWTVDGQVAGYTVKYKKNYSYLTFATIKGAGHTPAEYRPKECFEMMDRWLSDYQL